MTAYFSDREFGPSPRVEETIGETVWRAVLSLIETRIADGSLAYGFPEHCADGNAIVGTNESALSDSVRAEIGRLADDEIEGVAVVRYLMHWTDLLPDTPAILDLVEFVARHVAQSIQGDWHGFHSHHHLELDRETGLRKFVEDINRIFSRNGLAYELTDTGVIERTPPTSMSGLLRQTKFRTGDVDLDKLLDTAVDRFRLPKPETRQDALEKLWDAFERLKTIEDPDKKAGADALIDAAVSGDTPVFRSAVADEFKAMTGIGNGLRIRHSEVGQEPVGNNGEKDYLFMRLFLLIWLTLKRTERLA